MHGLDRLQMANSPAEYCSLSSNIEPCLTGPAQQSDGGAGGHVYGVCSQEGHEFVLLVTMTQILVGFVVNHFFMPPALSTAHQKGSSMAWLSPETVTHRK